MSKWEVMKRLLVNRREAETVPIRDVCVPDTKRKTNTSAVAMGTVQV